jgi:ketosteroid isomerase-like protein
MRIEDTAARLFAAIEAGDIEAVRELYAPEIVVWHNSDGKEQGRDANVAVLQWCVTHIEGMRYENVRRRVFEGGFVQQHTLRGRTRSGAELAVPGCLVVQVEADRITRIDEYLDSAHMQALLG